MAGGTANKTSALVLVALAKLETCKQALQELQQNGRMGATDDRHAAKGDPAVTAAITALQALQ